MNELQTVIEEALSYLSPRAWDGYTGAVIRGSRNWSGSDLEGKAKYYGAEYARQRKIAYGALVAAGGSVIRIEHGRLVTAVEVGTDDFGDSIYQTKYGYYRAPRAGMKNWEKV